MKENIRPFRRPTKGKSTLLAALDVGTSKICCLIAQISENDAPRIVGIGHHISHGLRAGNIVDLEAAQSAINTTLDNAEDMAGEKISHVVVNFSGGRMQSHHEKVTINLNGRDTSDSDIERAYWQARQNTLNAGTELLHIVPTDFTIDQQTGIRDPRGMNGTQLDVKLHLVTAQYAPIRTLLSALTRCHLQIDQVVVSPYASGLSALVDDEMEMGTTVIDMGGGTTSLAVFADKQLIHVDAVPVGGMHVTNDIARVLTTPTHHAERLKTLFGSALSSARDEKEIIDVPQVGEEAPEHANHIPKSHLIRVIQPRLEETFEMVKAKLEAARLNAPISRRVVLTGGACQLPGVREMAQRILDKQVRIGRPVKLNGLPDHATGPAFATAAGLLLFAVNPEAAMPRFGQDLGAGDDFFGKVVTWIKNVV